MQITLLAWKTKINFRNKIDEIKKKKISYENEKQV